MDNVTREALGPIRIKRVYEPPSPADGMRILVDRLWPRGVARQSARIDMWLREVAPSSELRSWFGHDPARFDEFVRRYRTELTSNAAARELVRTVALEAGRVTLLYGAKDEKHNQAVVLRDFITQARQRPAQ